MNDEIDPKVLKDYYKEANELRLTMTGPQQEAFLHPCVNPEDAEDGRFFHDLKIRDEERKSYFVRVGLTLNLSIDMAMIMGEARGCWQCSASLRRKRSQEHPTELEEWSELEHRVCQGAIEGVLGDLGAHPRVENCSARQGDTSLNLFVRVSDFEDAQIQKMYPMAPIYLKSVQVH